MKTMIASVLTALILTACTPKTAETGAGHDTIARAKSDNVVVRVNGTSIFASDVDLMAQEQGIINAGQSLPQTDPRYTEMVDELISQRLLALDADTQGLRAQPETQMRLAAARERILGNIRLEQHLDKVVNEDSLRRMYEEQSKLAARGDEIRARHILVEEKAEAAKLLKAIKDGEDFAKLARANSIDQGSAERGGDLGYFSQDMLSEDFSRPIFNAGKGEFVGPVKSDFGWHIAEVLDRRPAPQPSFETLKPQITNFMTYEAIEGLLKTLREDADVEFLTETVSTPKEPTDTDIETQPKTANDPEVKTDNE